MNQHLPRTETRRAEILRAALRLLAGHAPSGVSNEEMREGLEWVRDDFTMRRDVRDAAYSELREIEARDRLANRMGLDTGRPKVRHDGRALVFEAMTAAQARAHARRLAGGR